MIKRVTFALFFTLSTLLSAAQDKIDIGEEDYTNQQVEMADAFRADGKIYVVVAVVMVILLGLLAYVYLIDRKVSRIENEINERS
jgi:ABC-type amino acid transport system permease subunit